MKKFSKPVQTKRKKRKRPKPDTCFPAILRAGIALGIVLLFISSCYGQSKADSSQKAYRDIYEDIVCFRFEKASARLDSLEFPRRKIHPFVPLFRNYIDFFPAYLDGAPLQYERLKAQMNRRLELAMHSKFGPWNAYCRAEIHLQRALLDQKFQQYWSALTHLRKARKLLDELSDTYPEFKGDDKSTGLLMALGSTVPDEWSWAVRLLSGIKGDLHDGLNRIKRAAESPRDQYLFRGEAKAIYAFALFQLADQAKRADSVLHSLRWSPQESPLILFLQSNLYLETGRTDRAIELMDRAGFGEGVYNLHRLHLLKGLAKTYRGSNDAAIYLRRFVYQNPGNDFLKAAYQKLSWLAFLKRDRLEFERYRQCVIWYGEAEREADRSALYEAEQNTPLHPIILRARLYFDGGYYDRAIDLLDTLTLEGKEERQFGLEYHYRKGRCLHEMGRLAEAMAMYHKTIEDGRDQPEYYACNAALQAGKIYEQAGRTRNARMMYTRCLEMDPDNYRRSLHQKAEAGLARLE